MNSQKDLNPFYKPKGKIIRLWFIYIYLSNGLYWYRWKLTNTGYMFKNKSKLALLFSERNGLRGKTIGNWLIEHLEKRIPF